jgi:hypothetical protein
MTGLLAGDWMTALAIYVASTLEKLVTVTPQGEDSKYVLDKVSVTDLLLKIILKNCISTSDVAGADIHDLYCTKTQTSYCFLRSGLDWAAGLYAGADPSA